MTITTSDTPTRDEVKISSTREITLKEKIDPGRIENAIKKTQSALLDRQEPEGYWVGELEADISVSAGYIPLVHFMVGNVDPLRTSKIVYTIQKAQRPDGSWSTYYGGEGDMNVSIQAYFALKLAGVPASNPAMKHAADFILSRGGIDQANIFTKIWLSLFGQFDWKGVPTVPPEIILLPNWFYFNIYEFASWSRATIMALTIVLSLKPVCSIPEEAYIPELRLKSGDGAVSSPIKNGKSSFWRRFFLILDRIFKVWDRLPYKPGREYCLKKVEEWVVEHQEADGSWGGIMLPWIYSLFALKSLGYPLDHPVIARGLAGIEDFIVEDDSTFLLQPAVSPVWDTAWTVLSLQESGLEADHPALIRAARWLLEKEIRFNGDWKVKNPDTEPGGWSFEFENQWYPDLDDSALVPQALCKLQLPEELQRRAELAIERALNWILSMQSKDGGWAAFDRDNDKTILDHVPFADFMSPLDPTCPDVTAHILELLNQFDHQSNAHRQQAISYIKYSQENDGAWFGRWGVNYVYGTSLVLAGLGAAGEDPDQPYLQRAIAWLASKQNLDGGWGETCQTYDNPELRGVGSSTASQTAWALIGLLAVGECSSPTVTKGFEYLLRTQAEDGTWKEDAFTGTGFPGLFYLRYDLYRIYFPLLAFARYKASISN